MSFSKNIKCLTIAIFIFAIVFSISANIYSSFYQTLSTDNEQHYYEMLEHYKNKTFPYLGARLTTSGSLTKNDNTSQVPGGFFYIYYISLYQLASENIYITITLQTILFLLALSIFIFWIYKNFGFTIAVIPLAFIGVNNAFIRAATSFSNTNQVLLLSFLLCIFFGEYVKDKKYSNIFATLIFPITALMGQCHFGVYYSIVPTMIVYLLFRFNKTKKYLPFFLIGIFISFLLYLPYLIFEIKNGFSNSLAMINLADGANLPLYKRFPQIYGVIIFLTFILDNFNIKDAFVYWGALSPVVLLIIIISHIIAIASFILSIKYLRKSNIFNYENKEEDNLIRELLTLYFLYIPCTIISTMFLFGKGGSYTYLFSIYAFSFMLIVVLVKYIMNSQRKNILLVSLLILMFFHIPAVYLSIYKQVKFDVGRKQRLTYDLVKEIKNDSSTDKIYIEGRNIFRYAFNLFSYKDNIEINTNSSIIYFVEENKAPDVYTEESIDNINRSKKGDGYRDITLYYWYSYINKYHNDTNTFFTLDKENDKLIYTNKAFKLYKRM